MPLLDPVVVDAISAFLRAQSEAAIDQIATFSSSLPSDHPGRPEELEAFQDYWSHISSEWDTTGRSWLLANTFDD